MCYKYFYTLEQKYINLGQEVKYAWPTLFLKRNAQRCIIPDHLHFFDMRKEGEKDGWGERENFLSNRLKALSEILSLIIWLNCISV